MKNFILSAALAAVVIVPAVSLAAQYHYVDTTGTVRTITADNATQAFALAVNIAPHSGVAVDTGVLDSGDSVNGSGSMNTTTVVVVPNMTHAPVPNLYHYIDITGTVRNVTASSPAEAFALAVNIAPHSGVVVDAGTLANGDSVLGN